ncbi:MAG TPA: CoA pyrophosphatase [Myxococcaceae bacterium]|nr:CoA pyrophosphatase [Myxococcaceae bacterium]
MKDFAETLKVELLRHPSRPLRIPGVEGLRESAVLIPLRLREGEPHLLFTIRPQNLRRHAGQIAFPGGARDPSDASSVAAALREAHEEVGIAPDRVEILGALDEVATPSGFRITPHVGVFPEDLAITPDPIEVAATFEAPLRALTAPGVHRVERWAREGREWEVDFYPFGEHTIWGVTGRILRAFLTRAAPALGQRTTSAR